METSFKYKKLIRMRKLRRQRSSALIMLAAAIIMIAHGAFSKQSQPRDAYDVISVVVENGDTLWSIAKRYKPQNADFRKYMYEIAANNGVKDGNIVCGQTLYVPVTD